MRANFEHDLTRMLPDLLPLEQGSVNQRAVMESAEADGHRMTPPTHAIMKRGKIIGCAALGSVPLAHVWIDGAQRAPMDTALIFKLCESELRARGFKMVVVPTHAGAPLESKLEKHFGYSRLGDKILFGKPL